MKLRTVLLGAGASIDAGVPMAEKMTEVIYNALTSSGSTSTSIRSTSSPVKSALDVALGGIKYLQSTQQGKPFQGVGIEDLYATLIELSHRDSNVLAPFVGQWSQAVSSAETVETKHAFEDVTNALERDLSAHLGENSSRSRSVNLDQLRSTLRRMDAESRTRQYQNIYEDAAKKILNEVVKLTWLGTDKDIDYLLKLVDSGKDKQLRIATLNYDNTIELAASKQGIAIDYGFSGSTFGVEFKVPNSISLNKLHGSANWKFDEHMQITHHKDKCEKPAMIFGAGNKLRAEGPYLDLLLSFRSWLLKCDELEICGYSFRDGHVNAIIRSWVSLNPKSKVIVISPSINWEYIAYNLYDDRDAYEFTLNRFFEKQVELKTHFVLYKMKASEWFNSELQPS